MGRKKNDFREEFKPSAANAVESAPDREKYRREGFTRADQKSARLLFDAPCGDRALAGNPPSEAELRAAGIRVHRPLSESERAVVAWRALKLREFDGLRDQGLSAGQAALAVKVKRLTLWRWSKQIVPIRQQCGRKSVAEMLNVPPYLVDTVRCLQAAGFSDKAAWRLAARHPKCPKEIATYLSCSKQIAASLLSLSRPNEAKPKESPTLGKRFSAAISEGSPS